MKTLLKIASVIFCLCSVTLVLHAQVPQIINYQGRVLAGSTNFDGSGQFKFALVNAAGTTTYWSNNGSSVNGSEPSAAVTLTVTKGLYSVLLGDTTIANMTSAIPSSAFTNSDVRLRVWFNDGTHNFQLLTPDQRIAAVGYTFMADNIKDGAITMPKLANNAVGTANIVAGAVGSLQLASGLTLAGTTSIGGAINLPPTTSATNGVIQMNGTPILNARGTQNLFLGNGAGNFTLTGTQNTATGASSLAADTTGTGNTATGVSSLAANSTGFNNTATGFQALGSNTTASNNVATGQAALLTNTTGTNNTATGTSSLRNNNGSSNTATGTSSLNNNTTGSENTASGAQALLNNTSGGRNTATGTDALLSNTVGSENTAVGWRALRNTTANSSFNTAMGSQALFSLTAGGDNTAVGYAALQDNTASGNTATGSVALGNNTTGANNTACGAGAAITNTAGSGNTATGYGALQHNQSANNNTAMGFNALLNTTGSSNIGIGKDSGINLTTGSNNIDIGNSGLAGESDTIRIGSTQTATYLTGTVNITGDGSKAKIQAATAGNSSYMEFDDAAGGSGFRAILGADGPGFSGATNQFTIATWNNSPLALYTNQARRMTVGADGLVGIGITATRAALEVNFGGSFTYSNGTGFAQANVGLSHATISGTNTTPSIYAHADVLTESFFVAISDERVKNIIGRSDAARDLDTLLGIEITDYRYKDVIAHGDAPSKKVIAQQVEKVFPQAVKKQTGEVPDIYKLATIRDGWIALATDLKQGERVKLIADDAQGVYEVLEVRSGAFRTDFKSATGKVFVYGREVKDFRSVDYDAIAMLNVSATQEMQREIDSLQTTLNWQQKRLGDLKKEEQAQLAALRSENAKLRAENDANAKRLAALETRDKEREARLTRLEISMPATQPVANTIASSKTGGQ